MGTIKENIFFWNIKYDWKGGGDEWSSDWGGADMQWYSTILPRIHAFIPAEAILEIAPGYGRWTHFLKNLCSSLILVDVSEKCIQACMERFGSCSHITYHVNNGKSLEMIPNNSIDFIFTFDSLVHAEDDVIKEYLSQFAAKLKKDGVGFIHHSNIGEFFTYFSLVNKIPRGKRFLAKLGIIEIETEWRALSMTASKFRKYADESGLQCIGQEIINWRTKRLIDCISVITKKGSIWSRPNIITRNKNFTKEMSYIAELSKLYRTSSFKGLVAP